MEDLKSPFELLQLEAPAAASLTLLTHEILQAIARKVSKEPNAILTWAWFETIFGLTTSQARTRVGALQEAGLVKAVLIGNKTRPKGQRFSLTAAGHRVCELLRSVYSRQPAALPATAPSNKPVVEHAAPNPTHVDLTKRLSDKARARFDAMPEAARNQILTALRRGEEPDYEALAEHLPEPTLIAIAQYLERLMSASSEDSVKTTPLGVETRVPAASADKLALARAAGVPVPIVRSTTETSNGVAQHVELLLAETAVRHPQLLRSGELRRALPQLVWATLVGTLADYGPPLLRIRAATKWLAEKRWQCPRGFDPSAAKALLAGVRLEPATLSQVA